MQNVLKIFRSHSSSLFCSVVRHYDLRCQFSSTKQRYDYSSTTLFDETIYALSTAPGRAAIATIRASGPHCTQIYYSLCPRKPIPEPRRATIRKLFDPLDQNNVVDTASLVLYFPAPKTVTGEDVIEFQIHGGPATQKAVLLAISKVPLLSGLPIRYAEPGEFTKRAFQNEKLDLIQIEALSDTLSAETEQQRRAAVRGNSGKLGIIYDGWRKMLLQARAEIEALIDFSEDQNFEETPQQLLENVNKQISDILLETSKHFAASHCGELLKRGIRISLLGPPNVGKSSLLNQMVGREASIVSHEAGTTRDIVEVSLDLRGYLCTFADTAGLRKESTSPHALKLAIGAVEQEGIRRAKAKAINSDIIITMASIERGEKLNEWSLNYDNQSLAIAAKAPHALVVVNKCDQEIPPEYFSKLIEDFKAKINVAFSPKPSPTIARISCRVDLVAQNKNDIRENLHDLISQLVAACKKMTELPIDMEDLIGVTERQRLLLISCCSHLEEFKHQSDIVLAAEHLRLATICLSRVTGRGEIADVEEVLGIVFEKFCVGK